MFCAATRWPFAHPLALADFAARSAISSAAGTSPSNDKTEDSSRSRDDAMSSLGSASEQLPSYGEMSQCSVKVTDSSL